MVGFKPVNIVPEMTYNVLSGTLSLYTTTTTVCFPVCIDVICETLLS